jgi:hypothetical protein
MMVNQPVLLLDKRSAGIPEYKQNRKNKELPDVLFHTSSCAISLPVIYPIRIGI